MSTNLPMTNVIKYKSVDIKHLKFTRLSPHNYRASYKGSGLFVQSPTLPCTWFNEKNMGLSTTWWPSFVEFLNGVDDRAIDYLCEQNVETLTAKDMESVSDMADIEMEYRPTVANDWIVTGVNQHLGIFDRNRVMCPIEQLTTGTTVVVIMYLKSLWLKNGKCGVNWEVHQVLLCNQTIKMQSFAFDLDLLGCNCPCHLIECTCKCTTTVTAAPIPKPPPAPKPPPPPPPPPPGGTKKYASTVGNKPKPKPKPKISKGPTVSLDEILKMRNLLKKSETVKREVPKGFLESALSAKFNGV